MGLVLSVGFYACFLFFVAGYLVRIVAWAQQAPPTISPGKTLTRSVLLNALVDVLLLRRLLRVNDVLWVGEWTFHASLLILFLRHLRYVLEPSPAFVYAMEIPVRVAAWLLPASLLYIGAMKFVIEKKPYISSYNFMLLGLMMVSCVSGLVMKYFLPADLADIKHFTMGLVTFHAGISPGSITFLFHFVIFLVLLMNLPTHIIAAPLTMIEASQRDDELPYLLHEK